MKINIPQKSLNVYSTSDKLISENRNELTEKEKILAVTSRQPSNAGGFRRLSFTKPANDKGKQNKQQVNPALRLPAER